MRKKEFFFSFCFTFLYRNKIFRHVLKGSEHLNQKVSNGPPTLNKILELEESYFKMAFVTSLPK